MIAEEKFLIKSFKDGDVNAFKILYDKYHQKLYGFVFKIINSKEDCEEIIQDAFLKIWENRANFNEDYPFEPYLFKIAKNTFLNHIRKKINREVLDNKFENLLSLSENSTDEYVLLEETKKIIETIINELPPKRREIFYLRKIEGLSRKEVAEKLNISVITVDSQLFKANKQVSAVFKKYSLLFLIIAIQ